MVLVTDIGFAILRHVNDAKADINKFLADLTGTSQREIESLSMLEYSKLLIDFGKKAELKDFFQSIASLLG
jgi:F0F1-type ATP synthase membrane subunit b/b'